MFSLRRYLVDESAVGILSGQRLHAQFLLGFVFAVVTLATLLEIVCLLSEDPPNNLCAITMVIPFVLWFALLLLAGPEVAVFLLPFHLCVVGACLVGRVCGLRVIDRGADVGPDVGTDTTDW